MLPTLPGQRGPLRSGRVRRGSGSMNYAWATQANWGSGGWGVIEAQDGAAKLDEAVDKGIRCEIKEVFYVESEDPKEPGIFRWVDEKPIDIKDTKDAVQTHMERETYAILEYNIYDPVEKKWNTSHITINNPEIQSVLENVLEGYPGLTRYSLNNFSPQYLPFFHRWNEFTKHIEDEADEEAFHYLDLLRKMLLPSLDKTFEKWAVIKRTGHIEFKDLELAFNPGELAVYVLDGIRSVGVMRKASVEQAWSGMAFIAHLDVVDWDGRSCGLLSRTVTVRQYDGPRAFTALDVAPLRFFPDKNAIQKDLIARGRLFEKYRGQHFLAYTSAHEERANERIMIDAGAYYKFEKELKFPSYAELDEIGRLNWAQSMNRESTKEETEGIIAEADLGPLTDDQCLICLPTVHGFNIENKEWGTYEVSKFHEIPWDKQAFDNLVLDAEEKDLLLALVEREELSDTTRFDDFISGKGQGLVMLLSGPPGVGKTLTAESVAEHIRRPLYKISAGELGISARSVEDGLGSALELCSEWKAVCLIDEADVFMAARNVNNLERNELVSVFLRLLEYYSGILVLTTNRLRTLDSAFESRIDITLSYNPLTEANRRQVWDNFLRKLGDKNVAIDEAALDRLARWNFNGRQIKSAVKTGRILAARKKEPLNETHLEVVLRLRRKAWGLMGGDANGVAEHDTTIDVSNGTSGLNGSE